MSWRDAKHHFGRRAGKPIKGDLDQIQKGREATQKQAYDNMKKYIDKDEWEKHLKNKVKAKMEEWKKQSEGIGDRGYNDV